MSVRVKDRTITYTIDTRRDGPACFALGIRKSGSSIFSSIVNAVASFNELNTVDIAGSMFQQGLSSVDWNKDEQMAGLVWRGNAYIGFRDPPLALMDDPIFREARKIMLVRDPRDALVSEYFSNAFSHALPTAQDGTSVIERHRAHALQSGVEEYVLERTEKLNRTVVGFKRLIGDPNLLILRYEDIIFDKANWIRTIARHFGWEASDQLIGHILGWADVRPNAEDPKAFVRRVAPGDHLDKLSPAVIAEVNGKLSDVWRSFGYAIDG